MKITQVGIFADRKEDGQLRVQYENKASYITLAISDWLKNQHLDLGEFNRVLFTEASTDEDFHLVGIRALVVSLTKDFKNLEQFTNAQVTHEYFKQKYIEGFTRFDAHFALHLTPCLINMLNDYFREKLVYEKEMKSKRIQGIKHQVLKQYRYDVFNLILRLLDKNGTVLKETILQSGKPDPFLVYYDINKATIQDDKIQIFGSTGKVESEFLIEHL